MNKLSWILVMTLASEATYAQGTGGVTMSTDPAKAAAVEQHARELQARQSTEPMSKPATHAGTHKAKGKASTHKPATHKPATHKPATHKPATHKPATHKPATAPKS